MFFMPFFWYCSILLIKRRIFNILIDSSSLNIFSSLLAHLLQIIERTNVSSKMYDILGFLNFLCLQQATQQILFILAFSELIENTLKLFCHLLHFRLEKINW